MANCDLRCLCVSHVPTLGKDRCSTRRKTNFFGSLHCSGITILICRRLQESSFEFSEPPKCETGFIVDSCCKFRGSISKSMQFRHFYEFAADFAALKREDLVSFQSCSEPNNMRLVQLPLSLTCNTTTTTLKSEIRALHSLKTERRKEALLARKEDNSTQNMELAGLGRSMGLNQDP